MSMQEFEESLRRVDEILINQGVDPAELADPARQKIELAEQMGQV